MDKKAALRLMKDINMKFIVDDCFEEDDFLTILKNYIEVDEGTLQDKRCHIAGIGYKYFEINDVRKALKEFIDYMDYLLGDIHFIERKNNKAKDIFGKELIGDEE